MSDPPKIKGFPELKTKLSAPSKKSLFERQKAEAEAKRQREAAETAAVYEDFVKSFDDEPPNNGGSGTAPLGGFGRGFAGASRGPFGGSPMGRGGLGPNRGGRGGFAMSGPGSLGPVTGPPSKKRQLEASRPSFRTSNTGLLAFEDAPMGKSAAFSTSDEEDNTETGGKEERVSKPTLHLSSLPPNTSPAVIKSIFPSSITIDGVRMLPSSAPTGTGSTDRKSLSALVTVSKETPANDIDNAVSLLQNRYMGWGYYMSLSRHLSSAALSVGGPIPGAPGAATASLPFGAKINQPVASAGMGRGQNIHRGGYAPPTLYTPGLAGHLNRPQLEVAVTSPSDLRQLKLIHKTIESVLTHGPEFEALLMTRQEVQREEKWAWLWDARSTGGVWYRWRLWEILCGPNAKSKAVSKGQHQQVFEGETPWVAPEEPLRFEYVTRLDEFVSDDEYNSSEDEDSEDERRHRHNHHKGPPTGLGAGSGDNDERRYLNPIRKAKLAHLLARIPTTTAKLRKGDVARVTAFAIEHAGEGADEVVDMIVANIDIPFSFTTANPDHTSALEDNKVEGGKEDKSAAQLIALYLVSDILSSSSTSGVRHAWRYRQVFENTFKARKTFEKLGQLEKEMGWGRLRIEKWRRSVNVVLSLWEGWSAFSHAAHEHFVNVFANPPPTARELQQAAAATAKSSATPDPNTATKSKWKTVDVSAEETGSIRPVDLDAKPNPGKEADEDDDDGEPMDEDGDADGEPMEEEDDDDDVDGVPMMDIDGDPMEEDEGVDGEPIVAESKPDETNQDGGHDPAHSTMASSVDVHGETVQRRRRPRAEDMFADSDEEKL
jgi:U2-associated protein SR140